jgi:hypothetical protein
MKNYWHVTAVDNLEKIQNEGLKLNNGCIFLFDKKEYAPLIAINQCGLENYALFSISDIDETRLEADNVAELTAHAQWIYDELISPVKIKWLGFFKVTPKLEPCLNQSQ